MQKEQVYFFCITTTLMQINEQGVKDALRHLSDF